MRRAGPLLLAALVGGCASAAGDRLEGPLDLREGPVDVLEVEGEGWGGLEPGPHPVGFRSFWSYDATRTYRAEFGGGGYGLDAPAPRPVLVNLWYPADPRPFESDEHDLDPRLRHAEYFEVADPTGPAHALADALVVDQRHKLVELLFGVERADLSDADRATLAEYLGRRTAVIRDAPMGAVDPATDGRRGRAGDTATRSVGHHPVVIYHAGAGSTFDDNAILCEYLASWGCVVVGSPFLDADGESFGVDAGEGSTDDIVHILLRLAREEHVDLDRVHLVGHSLGAQALLRHVARAGVRAESLVLLDTTQDYAPLSNPLYRELVDDVLYGAEYVDQRVLVAAGPEAAFALVDRLTGAEREYLVLPGLEHDEYISQGHWRPGATPEARARFELLAREIRLFLGQGFEHEVRLEAREVAPEDLNAPYRLVVPAGVDRPREHELDRAPTPREFLASVRANGVEGAIATLAHWHGRTPDAPLFDARALHGGLCLELAGAGAVERARALHAAVERFDPGLRSRFLFEARLAELVGRTDDALRILEGTALLLPDDGEVAERLAGLRATHAGR